MPVFRKPLQKFKILNDSFHGSQMMLAISLMVIGRPGLFRSQLLCDCDTFLFKGPKTEISLSRIAIDVSNGAEKTVL